MSGSLIRLSPNDTPEPKTASIPEQAIRWRSQYEVAGYIAPVSIYVTAKAFIRFCAHAGSDLQNEVGGWLVGKWRADEESGQEFLIVHSVLPALYTRHGSAYLTFTQDSQVAMHAMMEERYPESELVGWYHTHPRMGVFLSSYDTWLHGNFFPHPWQVALVIEPVSATAGFFIPDQEGVLDNRRYYGFHELYNGRKSSVVHWTNLHPDEKKGIPSNNGDMKLLEDENDD